MFGREYKIGFISSKGGVACMPVIPGKRSMAFHVCHRQKWSRGFCACQSS